VLADVFDHARAGYPEEVCGLLVGAPGVVDEVRRCDNRQNALHASDPARFPRDARTAYNLGDADLLYIGRSERTPRPVQVIYHSHVDVGAYFSAEDVRQAVPPEWGEPAFPGIDYLVIDAQKDGARLARLFRFSGGEFVQIAEYSAA
jgi:adenylyltransferase/sulfurtransferase